MNSHRPSRRDSYEIYEFTSMEFALGLLAAIPLKLEQLHIDTSFEFAVGLLAAILLRLVWAWWVAREPLVAEDTCQ